MVWGWGLWNGPFPAPGALAQQGPAHPNPAFRNQLNSWLMASRVQQATWT